MNKVKLNLESDYLIVQFIYECNRAKGISYIVSGQRGLGIGLCTKGEWISIIHKKGVSGRVK